MQEMQEVQVQSLGWEDPLEKGMQPTPVFMPWKSYGQRSLAGYSPRGCKESDTTEVTSHAHSILAFVQFSSVAQLCPTLCDHMDCSTAGFPVHHQLPEFTQTHVH